MTRLARSCSFSARFHPILSFTPLFGKISLDLEFFILIIHFYHGKDNLLSFIGGTANREQMTPGLLYNMAVEIYKSQICDFRA
jgi:hypothetical protein